MPVIPHPYGTFLALGVIVGGLTYLICLAVRMEEQ